MIPCVIELTIKLTIKISNVNALLKEVMVEFDTTQQIKFQDAKQTLILTAECIKHRNQEFEKKMYCVCTQRGNFGNSLSRNFGKNSVKIAVLLNKLLNS